jgi:putative zinc finger/helix-turn-helix YgiT family protein
MEAEAPRQVDAEVKGVALTVTMTAPACPKCGHVSITGKSLRAYMQLAADAYRQKEDLLTSEAMERVREQFGLTQADFAEHLFVGIATYKRWLGGEIQSRAYDKLVRLRTDPGCAKSSAAEVIERLMTPNSDVSDVVMVKKPRVTVQAEKVTTIEQGGMAA